MPKQLKFSHYGIRFESKMRTGDCTCILSISIVGNAVSFGRFMMTMIAANTGASGRRGLFEITIG